MELCDVSTRKLASYPLLLEINEIYCDQTHQHAITASYYLKTYYAYTIVVIHTLLYIWKKTVWGNTRLYGPIIKFHVTYYNCISFNVRSFSKRTNWQANSAIGKVSTIMLSPLKSSYLTNFDTRERNFSMPINFGFMIIGQRNEDMTPANSIVIYRWSGNDNYDSSIHDDTEWWKAKLFFHWTTAQYWKPNRRMTLLFLSSFVISLKLTTSNKWISKCDEQ